MAMLSRLFIGRVDYGSISIILGDAVSAEARASVNMVTPTAAAYRHRLRLQRRVERRRNVAFMPGVSEQSSLTPAQVSSSLPGGIEARRRRHMTFGLPCHRGRCRLSRLAMMR